ncbi:MAG: alpha/beta hydrolase [Gemmatimonadota bacterium]|nr:alpha/beta hydrolase [Gemmatimonadota bacterium]
MTRRIPAAIASLALVVAAAACDSGPSIRPVAGATLLRRGELTTRPIVFATDDYYVRPAKTEAEEGWLRVPENRQRPTGRHVQIHFVRFPSRAARPAYPIVYLAGGPGGSGTRSAAGDRFPLFMHLRDAGDVIALDQRGVAFTMPSPACPGSWSYPLDRPLDEGTLTTVMTPWLRHCAEHWKDSLDLSAFTARESADDLEDLRRALGVEKLSLWGISYGTHLALAYTRRYPHRVHRAILAGVEGPDHTWKLPANVERSLRRLDSALAADPRARARVPDFLPRLRRTLAQLSREPATVEIEDSRTGERRRVTVGVLDLQRALFFAQRERETIAEIFRRVAPVLDGDYAPLAEFAYRTRLERGDLVMALSTDCAAGATAARRELIQRQVNSALLGDVANLDLRVTCGAWPVAPLDEEFRAPVRAVVPVLAISGTLDNRTPPENAEEVLAGFPNGSHLVINGAGHDDDLFLSSPKIPDAMLRFLLTGDPGVRTIELRPIRFKLP